MLREQRTRPDRHLIEEDNFLDANGLRAPPVELPYAQIDLIFNQKNMWANLANKNPAAIYYHLHDEYLRLRVTRLQHEVAPVRAGP